MYQQNESKNRTQNETLDGFLACYFWTLLKKDPVDDNFSFYFQFKYRTQILILWLTYYGGTQNISVAYLTWYGVKNPEKRITILVYSP